ncbi:MAG: peptidyl-prolyl cis-trans isomerase [Verrucomicrobiota bacterium]|nr:peptidyl-prolyl cis-trans isomerase [Verrucomicrobiota bacterium]
MSKLRRCTLVVAALLAGVICSELLCRWSVFRDGAGRVFHRGRLMAIVGASGLYEKDLEGEEIFTTPEVIAAENLRRRARGEQVAAERVEREMALLRAPFGDVKLFDRVLRSSDLSLPSLSERIADQLRSRQWIERQVASEMKVGEQECRMFYDAHRELFAQPLRFRASHIFLAAHAETPADVVESKSKAIDALAVRLTHGEALAQLAAKGSEDEATKSRGGDLGYFSSARIDPEFFAEVAKLAAGQTSQPFRTHLGFHIVRVTDIEPPRPASFEEVREEIALALANERRVLLVGRLAEALSRADYVRAD